MKKEFTAKCFETNSEDGYRFQFFCALCGTNYTSGWIHADSEERALDIAKAEARLHFNLCHSCGKWVCDEHYDIDEMVCLECANSYVNYT